MPESILHMTSKQPPTWMKGMRVRTATQEKTEGKQVPSISEVLDCEWQQAGMSLEEIEQNKQIGALFDRLIASSSILTPWPFVFVELACSPQCA